MNTLTDSDVPVLNPRVVYHLPKELEGPFAAGPVKRGKVRRVSGDAVWARMMADEEGFARIWRAAGY